MTSRVGALRYTRSDSPWSTSLSSSENIISPLKRYSISQFYSIGKGKGKHGEGGVSSIVLSFYFGFVRDILVKYSKERQ